MKATPTRLLTLTIYFSLWNAWVVRYTAIQTFLFVQLTGNKDYRISFRERNSRCRVNWRGKGKNILKTFVQKKSGQLLRLFVFDFILKQCQYMMMVRMTTKKTIIITTNMFLWTITVTDFRFLLTVIIAMTGPIKAHTVPSSKASQHLKEQANLVFMIFKRTIPTFVTQRNTTFVSLWSNWYSHVAVAVVFGLHSSCYTNWNDCKAYKKNREILMLILKKIRFSISIFNLQCKLCVHS